MLFIDTISSLKITSPGMTGGVKPGLKSCTSVKKNIILHEV